jgi:hypothetical protein
MRFTNIARKSAWAGVAAVALLGTACAAQEKGAPQATVSVRSAGMLPLGPVVNFGQGAYVVPVVPPSPTETTYALTGQQMPRQWPHPEGYWVAGTNGTTVFVPSVP